jgi:hypothetical protein
MKKPPNKRNLTARRGLTTLRRDDTTFAERAVEELKVRLLEEGFSRTFRVARVCDDDVELALLVLEELEAVADDGLGLGVFETNRHAGQVLLGETDDGLVDVAENSLLDTVVLDDLSENTAVAAADDEDLLGVGVGVHGEVGNHLLVADPPLATFSLHRALGRTRTHRARCIG